MIHVDTFPNSAGAGPQSGYICGLAESSFIQRKDRWPGDRSKAEARAKAVGLGIAKRATQFLQDLLHGVCNLKGTPSMTQMYDLRPWAIPRLKKRSAVDAIVRDRRDV